MTKADPTLTDRLSQIVSDAGQGLPRRMPRDFASLRGGEIESGLLGPSPAGALPNRYEIRQIEAGRVLLCDEAPGVAVTIDRRYAMSEAEARKLGGRVILLDGAGQFGPVMDDGDNFYNLDHHAGCVRAFTLATCEQALILVLKGLRLDKGDWTVYANEPDLDTVFAIWVLLNYRRVRELTPAQRDAILPLLRLEGAIDSNGFEIAEHCGLPQVLLQAEKEQLDRLHANELELKGSGRWSETDLYQYTRDMLLEIDHLVYRSADFSDYTSIQEVYGHVDIGHDHVAVVCRDDAGIYEVEKRLKKVWGARLGIIALERSKNEYTLRRAASLAGISLADAYSKLNLLDPAVDGHPPEKRWGGSDEIGGSPRPDGTGLTPREIGKILKLTFNKVSPLQHLQRFAAAALWVVALALGAGVAVFSWHIFAAELLAPPQSAAAQLALGAAVLGVGAGLLTRRLSRGWTWLFGWRAPAGRDWLLLLPVVLAGGVAGGAWIPPVVAADAKPLAAALGAAVAAGIALELCFRGLMHGLLVLDYPVQSVRGKWFVSRPVAVTAVLYTLLTAVTHWLWLTLPPFGLPPLGAWALLVAGSFAVSFALGMIRERSLSVWPAAGALAAAGVARILCELWCR